jgi:long-chain acyl-CoA synthetase
MTRSDPQDDGSPPPRGGIYGRLRARSGARGDALALVGDARSVRPSTTYEELFAHVDAAAAGFYAAGVRKGVRVGVASDNFDRWIVSDLALLSLGAVSVPRGADASPQEIGFCFAHAECEFALFETAALYDRCRAELPPLRRVVILKGPAPAGALAFDDLAAAGRDATSAGKDGLAAVRDAVASDDLATIVYTSGTTGNPKGVMLTHGNVLHNLRALPRLFAFRPGMRFLSFLPTWHTFERTVEYVCLDNGLEIHYSSKRALKADLARIRPDFLVGVPRVWETLYQGVVSGLEKLPAKKRAFVDRILAGSRAFHRARRRAFGLAAERDGAVPTAGYPAKIGLLLGMAATYPAERLARRLVYSKLLAALGGRLSIAISGGGPLPLEIEEFFLRAGVPFYNGYGLTETAPVACVRRPDRNVLGTIGPPLPETQVRVVGEDGADLGRRRKGVIQIRGPQVMRGYWKNEAATRACLSADGWFDSGDVGLVADDGEIMITGRAKDTLVLRGGENVEPENIETALAASPCFVDIVVVGHAQKALGALVVPDYEVVRTRLGGLPEVPAEQLSRHPAVERLVRAEISAVVSSERGFRTFEMIGRFACLPTPFSTEDGTLTPTMKKKRRVIEERYAALIASLFAD